MTALAPPAGDALARGGTHDVRPLQRLAALSETARSRIALTGVGLLAAALYLWDLTISGYANAFYSAAALAGSQSWSAWFFGSLDAGNFITVDKPPLATMLMGLSVRLLGLSSLSVLLPQALLGVATVMLLFEVVRRPFGGAAATIAAVAMALTPVAALMFRFDHPDALLTFLMVAGAWGVQRAIAGGRHRWLVVAGAAVGLAFLTKYLQGFLVLPAFAFAYAVAANASLRRRIAGIGVLAVSTLVASGWWVAAVQLTPAALRPYIGGSTNDSVLDLVFGYDGLGRIFGQGGGGGSGVTFSGAPGILRLFNLEFGGQISWLLPVAVASLAFGLLVTARRPRTDRQRAAYLLWGGWLAIHAVVFSFMSGIVHSYYAVAMAPAVAALVGAGAVEAWRLRERTRLGGLLAAGAVVVTAAWAYVLLGRSPSFAPGLDVGILAVGLAAALLLGVPIFRGHRRIGLVASGLALVAILAGPGAFTLDTVATAYSGSIVSAGPATTGSDGGMGGPGGGSTAGGPGGGGLTASIGSPQSGTLAGGPPSAGSSSGTTGGPSGSAGAMPGGNAAGGMGQSGGLDQATVDYLLANRGGATWIVAVSGSMNAAQIELQTGAPVMAMGGWSGSDPAPTLSELKADVASGKLRFVLVSGGGAGGGQGTSSDTTAWITATGKAVTIAGSSGSGGTLYDLGGAATPAA